MPGKKELLTKAIKAAEQAPTPSEVADWAGKQSHVDVVHARVTFLCDQGARPRDAVSQMLKEALELGYRVGIAHAREGTAAAAKEAAKKKEPTAQRGAAARHPRTTGKAAQASA